MLDKLRDCAYESANLLSPNTHRVDTNLERSTVESTPKRPRLCVSAGPESSDTPVVVSSHTITAWYYDMLDKFDLIMST